MQFFQLDANIHGFDGRVQNDGNLASKSEKVKLEVQKKSELLGSLKISKR